MIGEMVSTIFKCIIQHSRDEEQLKACKQTRQWSFSRNLIDEYKTVQKKKIMASLLTVASRVVVQCRCVAQ